MASPTVSTSTHPPTNTTNTPFASASLYVGDLNQDVTEALLFEIFNAVGPVASVRVCRDSATRRSLGYAYVNFHRPDDAERALDTMNFSPIKGRPCRIMWSHRDPSLRKSGLGNIFVKNLAKTIDNKSLYDTFSVFGNILSCKVAVNQKRESLGYGFVHYESEEAAQQAIERVNGMVIGGETVNVQAFKSKKERGGADKTKYTNVYVKNLPEEFTKEQLESMFSKYGAITSAMLAIDEKNKCKGFGFVNFQSADMAATAVQGLNDKETGAAPGKKLVVCRAQKKDEREKELHERFEQWKLERQKKFAGVNLYIKNLSDKIDNDRLRTAFAPFGNISSVHVMMNDNKSRGFGFVCFSSPEEATKAVTEMNGHMLEGKPLYVALAQRKEIRRAQLEAQYTVRPGHPMQPLPQGYMSPQGPVYYGGMGPMMPNYFPQRPPVAMMQPYSMMQPMPQRGVPQMNRRGRGGLAQGRRPQQGHGMPYKYGTNVRNTGQQPVQQPAVQQVQGAVAAPAPPPAAQTGGAEEPLVKALAAAEPEMQKQMLGERLFPLIQQSLVAQQSQQDLAGKITGMLLEMDNGELLHLLESPDSLRDKVREALAVLEGTEPAARS